MNQHTQNGSYETTKLKNEGIIVYSKNNCPGCSQVKFALNAAGVEYEERNVEESEVYKAEFDKLGYSAAPVTVFPSGTILAGFDFALFANELGL